MEEGDGIVGAVAVEAACSRAADVDGGGSYGDDSW